MTSHGISNDGIKLLLNLVTGGLSLIGSFWVFHFYSKTMTPRPVSMKLILWLSIADFIYSIANLLSPFDANIEGLCTFEAVLRIFSVMSGLFWSTCIAILTYQTLNKGKAFQQDSFFKKTVALGLLIPIIFTVSPLLVSNYSYGPVTFGCYIVLTGSPTQVDELIMMLIYDGIPVLIALTVTLVLYFKIAKIVEEYSDDLTVSHDISITRLFWYPAVIFLAYIPSFIDNMIELFDISSKESEVFTIVHILLTHSVGFTNALVYGLQRKKYYEIYEEPKIQLTESTKSTPLFSQKVFEISVSEGSGSGYNTDYEVPRRSSCDNELFQASIIGNS